MHTELRAVGSGARYHANPALHDLLEACIVAAGVRPGRRRKRTFDPEAEAEHTTGDLLWCFGRYGCLITAAEAGEIADKLEGALPGWIAHPVRREYSSVRLEAVEWDEEHEPTRWLEYVPVGESGGLPRAAEAGATQRSIALVRKFIAFCRGAAESGGFYVYVTP